MSGNAYRLSTHPTSEVCPFKRAEAAVYALEPAYAWSEGVSSFVIVDANRERGTIEVFAADGDGRLLLWEPVILPIPGRFDHAAALREMGYVTVAVAS